MGSIMNKFLLGTTALISAAAFTAPAIAAEKIQLELRGYHVGGVSITNGEYDFRTTDVTHGGLVDSGRGIDNHNDLQWGSDSEVHFRGSTTLDNGLKMSFRAELELEDDDDVDGDADNIDEVYIDFIGGFGTVEFGQNDGVMFQQHIAAPNTFIGHGPNQADIDMNPFGSLGDTPFLGGELDGSNPINTYGNFSNDHIKLTYLTPNMEGFQVGASFTPNNCKNDTGYTGCAFEDFGRNFWEVAGSFNTNLDNIRLGISMGYGQGESGDADDEPMEWSVGGEIGFGGVTIGGSYRDANLSGNSTRDETHWDVGVEYDTGPWGFSATYGSADADWFDGETRDAEAQSFTAGASYMYGPGMQIGLGVSLLDKTERMYDGHYLDTEGFEGTSFFIENAMRF